MAWFSFNGHSSEDLGLILPETPFRPSWAENTEKISIPGKADPIRKFTGVYENQTITIQAVVTDMSRINTIYNILHGEGQLILSTAPHEYMTAWAEPLVPKAVALDMAEIPIAFDCSPFAYSDETTETRIVASSYTEFQNNGSIYTAPVFQAFISPRAEPILKGDVNFDGKVDSVDAAMVLAEYERTSAGQEATFTDEQKVAADMNEDGYIDNLDAVMILQEYAEHSTTTESDVPTPAATFDIIVNGGRFVVGVPSAVMTNGFTVTVDCGLHLIYYTDLSGNTVNIMQYSSLDMPLLHTGTNYVKYSGSVVREMKMIVRERWL